MKLNATLIPHSSMLSGGLRLIDAAGQTRFVVSVSGSEKITWEQTAAISKALIEGIPEGIEVPGVKNDG